MSNERTLTKAELVEIAKGIAFGRTEIEIAGRLSVDRSTLGGWLRRDGFLYDVAEAMTSPDDLGADGLAYLRDEELHEGERKRAWALRLNFWEIVQWTFPDFFEKERRAKERARRARQRRDEAEARKAEAEERRAEEREARAAECHRADYFNLRTLCEVCKRNWRDGTADEKARGLDTPEKRRAHRCRHGMKWDCAGIGVYYSPTWSANRCEMEYREAEAGFYAIAEATDFAQAWAEIEAEQADEVAEQYQRDPFKRRDPRLPTAPDEAEALWQRISGGADFAEAASLQSNQQ